MQSHTKTEGAIRIQHGRHDPVVREESMPHYGMKLYSHSRAQKDATESLISSESGVDEKL